MSEITIPITKVKETITSQYLYHPPIEEIISDRQKRGLQIQTQSTKKAKLELYNGFPSFLSSFHFFL